MRYSETTRVRPLTQVEKREMAQLRAILLSEHQELNESNDIIAAERYDDIERLRVYAKLLRKPGLEGKDEALFVTHVLTKCVLMLRRLGYSNIDQFLTKDMVHAFFTVNAEIGSVYSENPNLLFPDASDDVMRLVLEDITQSERIANIIRERGLAEAREIREVLQTMESSHSAVVSGAL